MRGLSRRRLAWMIAAALVPAAAQADHAFILPSSTSLSGEGNMVTFDAAGSDHVFFFDHRPLQLGSIRVWKPDGTAGMPTNTLQGRFRSVFDLRLDQPGTWKVASEQTMITGSFTLAGEERRVGPPRGQPGRGPDAGQHGDHHDAGQPGGAQPGGTGGSGEHRQPPVAFEDIPAAATDVRLIEMVSRAETFVTDGAPTATVFKPQSRGLELDPITHPNALAQGETARFRLLIDGRPAHGIKVTVIPGGDRYRDDLRAIDLVTGADGVVAVTWPAAGLYWLGAEAEDRNPAEKKAEARRMSYSATLEVMTP